MRTQRTLSARAASVLAILGMVVAAIGLSLAPATSAEDAHPGLALITAKALVDHPTDDTEWHFVITQLRGLDAPLAITVVFDDGATVDFPLEKVTGGTAHYRLAVHLEADVTAATAWIDPRWDGQFNLSHGPAYHGPTTTTTVPETTTTTVPETTTTTVPETTTTTVPETTTTTAPETTTTTVPETTTTTAPETTTTTAPETTTTTVPETTTTMPTEVLGTTTVPETTTTTVGAEVLGVTVERGDLPRTGSRAPEILVGAGLATILAGAVLVLAERRTRTS